jgi:hypothetical protein
MATAAGEVLGLLEPAAREFAVQLACRGRGATRHCSVRSAVDGATGSEGDRKRVGSRDEIVAKKILALAIL